MMSKDVSRARSVALLAITGYSSNRVVLSIDYYKAPTSVSGMQTKYRLCFRERVFQEAYPVPMNMNSIKNS